MMWFVLFGGGGSRLDLASFDSYLIGKSIAEYPLPILIGIGHEIDQTIPDMVAYRSLKTPTAVAAFIIDHNVQFEERLLNQVSKIYRFGKEIYHQEERRLADVDQTIRHLSGQILQHCNYQLQTAQLSIKNQYKHQIGLKRESLNQISQAIDLLDPRQILELGYAMAIQGNKWIRKVNDINQSGLSIAFSDGKIDVQLVNTTEDN